MQTRDCVEIEKDMKPCEGLGHTNASRGVVWSPLEVNVPIFMSHYTKWVPQVHTLQHHSKRLS